MDSSARKKILQTGIYLRDIAPDRDHSVLYPGLVLHWSEVFEDAAFRTQNHA
jgi:hypothetical protein